MPNARWDQKWIYGTGIKGKLNISGKVTGNGSNTPVVKYQLTTVVQKSSM